MNVLGDDGLTRRRDRGRCRGTTIKVSVSGVEIVVFVVVVVVAVAVWSVGDAKVLGIDGRFERRQAG